MIMWITVAFVAVMPLHAVDSLNGGGGHTSGGGMSSFVSMGQSSPIGHVTGGGLVARSGFAYTLQSVDLDLDDDGIPNAWELANALNPTNAADATQDADGDGVDNHDEYVADTDPQNSNAFFAITAMSLASPVDIFFESSAARLYTLKYVMNLPDGVWSNLPGCTDVPGSGGADFLTDTNEVQWRFYRIGVRVP